jgi:alpha-D-xyloside xylohydrolase
VAGPRWLRETHDFGSLPLLARPNSVIPLGNRTDRPDYDYADGLTLQVYELEPGQKTVNVPTPEGATGQTFSLRREGGTLEVERRGPVKPWQLLLVGLRTLSGVEGGSAELTPSGVLVTPDANGGRVVVRLADKE